MTVKIALVAPIPKARLSAMMAVNIGLPRITRRLYRKSFQSASIGQPPVVKRVRDEKCETHGADKRRDGRQVYRSMRKTYTSIHGFSPYSACLACQSHIVLNFLNFRWKGEPETQSDLDWDGEIKIHPRQAIPSAMPKSPSRSPQRCNYYPQRRPPAPPVFHRLRNTTSVQV